MYYIGVCGGSHCDEETAALAEQVGKNLAQKGLAMICGGGGGVMEAASRGAVEAGGLVLGILSGDDPRKGNAYLSASVATGLGEARNAVITRTSDAVIAIGGEYGTLSEIGLALKMGKPVIGLNTWRIQPFGSEEVKEKEGKKEEVIVYVSDPREAVDKAIEMAEGVI